MLLVAVLVTSVTLFLCNPQAVAHKTPKTPRTPKTPLGHSSEETLNAILDSLNVWTLHITAGMLQDWLANMPPSGPPASHDVRTAFLTNQYMLSL